MKKRNSSVNDRSLGDMSDMAEAIALLYPIVSHEDYKQTFLTFSLFPNMEKTTGITFADETTFVNGIAKAFSNKYFADFVGRCIAVGQTRIWEITESCLEAAFAWMDEEFKDNTEYQSRKHILRNKATEAYKVMRTHLCGNPHSLRWITLVFFALTKAIAINARREFDANEWSEVTLLIFELEKAFITGDGVILAQLFKTLDMKYYNKELSNFIGAKMDHALSELSRHAFSSKFFKELTVKGVSKG